MARAEVVALGERVWALPGSVNCAIVRGDDDAAVLVDTGQDKDYGRALRRACEALGLTPAAIVTTHAHADHFGGNAYLLRQFPDVVVYAPPFEASLMRDPYLEPVYLFHGARPLPELTTRWLQAEPSPVHVELAPGELEVAGVRVTVLDTSGHAHRQVSLLVDDVLLAADAVFGPALLERYPLPFAQDVGGQVRAFDTVARSGARIALPGHGDPEGDLPGLARRNDDAVRRAADAVAAACEGVGTEEVLVGACAALGSEVADLARYHLNHCTVSAYLGWLRAEGIVRLELDAGRLRWTRA